MSNEDKILISEIIDYKDEYLSYLKKENSPSELQKINIKYQNLVNAFNRYVKVLEKEVNTRKQYQKALTSHKINPYTAAGIGNGIGGIVAGVYMGNEGNEIAKHYQKLELSIKKQKE